jgi:hypothetical protein
LSLSKCKISHEFKAVSQNFGHENIGTIMIAYGSLNNSQVGEMIGEMNFGESACPKEVNLISEFQEFLKAKSQNKF